MFVLMTEQQARDAVLAAAHALAETVKGIEQDCLMAHISELADTDRMLAQSQELSRLIGAWYMAEQRARFDV